MSKDNQVHVANNIGESIYVMVTPNPAYAFADFGINFIKTAVLAVLTGGIEVKDIVSSLRDLATAVEALRTAKKAAEAASAKGEPVSPDDQASIDENYASTKAYLEQNAFKISPHNFTKVSDIGLLNPMKYLTPSAWAAVCGGSDLSIFLATESLDKYAMFNTNSDDSWIFNAQDVVRSVYGSIWQQDKKSGFYRLSLSDRLPAGSSLEVDQSLASSNGNYNFVYQEDGNAVVYKRDGAQDESAPWSSRTMGKSTGRLTQQVDGNLVIYDANGAPVWASGSTGSGEEYEQSKVVMQDDGNLVVYTASGRAIWACKDHE